MTSTLTAELRDAIEDDRDPDSAEMRAVLTAQLAAAQEAIKHAQWAIERLSSDAIYDNDFVDGTDTADFLTDTADFLTDAARMVRAAIAFNPQTT